MKYKQLELGTTAKRIVVGCHPSVRWLNSILVAEFLAVVPAYTPALAQDSSAISPDSIPVAPLAAARQHEGALLTGRINTLRIGAGADCANGAAYRDAGNLDEAVVYFQRAIQDNPHELRAMVALGEIYSRRGQHMQSLACYQMATMECPCDPELRAKVEMESSQTAMSPASQQRFIGSASRSRTEVRINPPAQPAHPERQQVARGLVRFFGGLAQIAAVELSAQHYVPAMGAFHVGTCTPNRYGILMPPEP